MDSSEDDSATRGSLLLSQLDHIFLSDPLIDELGFVHPSQLTNLHASDESTINDSLFSDGKNSNSRGSTISSSSGGEEPNSRADCSRKSEHGGVDGLEDEGYSFQDEQGVGGLPYDPTAFWCGEHKLAISLKALAPMFRCGRAAFMSIRADYKKLLQAEEASQLTPQSETVGIVDTMGQRPVEDNHNGKLNASTDKWRIEDSLMKYSRALVLINCDYASAWSTRKQIIVHRAANQELLPRELHMAGVVLSCGPKSEETWAYRRWVINQMISGGIPQAELDSLLEAESKLVEAVAERSVMNYRAWRHRCWLVSQMSFLQVGIELHRTKAWAVSHVADNCCFHYRREGRPYIPYEIPVLRNCTSYYGRYLMAHAPVSLLLKLINSKVPERSQFSSSSMTAFEKRMDLKVLRVSLLDGSETTVLWKEEIDWIKNLIQQYIGREALWIHLRFLLFSWVNHIGAIFPCRSLPSLSADCKKISWDLKEALCALENEEKFVDECLSACSSVFNEAEDRQKEYAATYKLWVTMVVQKQLKQNGKNGWQTTYEDEFSNLKQLLHEVAPHRKELWSCLLPNLELA